MVLSYAAGAHMCDHLSLRKTLLVNEHLFTVLKYIKAIV